MHLTIRNVRAVLPDRVLDSATVRVEDGTIVAIDDCAGGVNGSRVIDGAGLLLMPGLIDSHSDGLETEISPRVTVRFNVDYALVSFEGRLRSAGVTTVHHGVSYRHVLRDGRSVETAREIGHALIERTRSGSAAVDHRFLYRFESREADTLDPLLDDLAERREAGADVPLVSFEDHTPGQGQYRDPNQYAAAVSPEHIPDGLTPREYVDKIMAEAEQTIEVRQRNLEQLVPLVAQGHISMLAHDAETIDDIHSALDAGATVAEFPVTLEAAEEAKKQGMSVVMGAPNALRGVSHSGNASARELIGRGLCDVIASDYMPSAMLASVFELVNEGLCALPHAVAMITKNPAEMAGIDDRGRLEIGGAADLILVDDRKRWPAVIGVMRAQDELSRHVMHR